MQPDEQLAAWQAELDRLEVAQLAQSQRVRDLSHERAYPVQQAIDLDAALGRIAQSATKSRILG